MFYMNQFVSGQFGEIQLILGPMFSGKTTELLRRIQRYQIAKRRCFLIKYLNDCRYEESSGCIVTHDRVKMSAASTLVLYDTFDQVEDFDVIGIDEGQFFPDIVAFSEELALKGKVVIVAALDGTYQRKPFGKILDLIPLAEHIMKLKAICHYCGRDASFTKRIINDDKIEVIGGQDKYLASCRECYKIIPDR